jgi:hypothetical protein
MAKTLTDETEAKAKKLGMTGHELRALIKPIFMALHKNNRISITIERDGTLVKVEIQ